MSSKILIKIPPSGELEEIHFGKHFSQALWVEFEPNECEKWFGCFPLENINGYNTVLTNKENEVALVVASGFGYLIDIEKKKMILKIAEYPPITSAILTENPNYFVLGTYYSVYVIDNEKIVQKISPDFMVEGIYFKKQENGNAIGDLASAENHYESNIDFNFDLLSFKMTLDQKVKRKRFRLF
ncbi:hypothetical protein [Gaetbulibacter aestuarii]|uniref:Uncharacterized protein n=1 Tax=Gaetbulibacter aestuarii TaxID=1502358 RepID=A0ABW7MW32_9FLAO